MTVRDAGMRAVQLRYGVLVVRVEADEPSHLAWLGEFLAPQFELAPGALPHRVVRIVSDAARYAGTLGRGPARDAAEVATFALDTGTVRLPRWESVESGDLTLHDPGFRVFYTVNREARSTEVLTAPGNGSVRNGAMRVVRELATACIEDAGGLVLHGAAVGRGDRILALAGPKGAGKTTLLIHLLRRGSTTLVANDRVAVLEEGRAPAARGLPTIVKVRRDTMDWFPEIRPRFLSTPFHHRRTMEEAAGRPAPSTPAPDGYWSLSAAQLCALLGVHASGGGRLVAVVFPRIVSGGPGLTLRAIPPGSAPAVLRTARLGLPVRDVEDGPWREIRAGGAPRGDSMSAVAEVPAFVGELSATAYRDPASADVLLALLEA